MATINQQIFHLKAFAMTSAMTDICFSAGRLSGDGLITNEFNEDDDQRSITQPKQLFYCPTVTKSGKKLRLLKLATSTIIMFYVSLCIFASIFMQL